MAGINFSQSAQTFFPDLPEGIKDSDPELYQYLQRQKMVLQQIVQGLYSNDDAVRNAVNKGTSGTFAIASGGHIVITSGIVTSVSTT